MPAAYSTYMYSTVNCIMWVKWQPGRDAVKLNMQQAKRYQKMIVRDEFRALRITFIQLNLRISLAFTFGSTKCMIVRLHILKYLSNRHHTVFAEWHKKAVPDIVFLRCLINLRPHTLFCINYGKRLDNSDI